MKESTRSLIKIIIAVVVKGTLAALAWHYIKERLYGTYSSYEVISEMKLSSDVKCHNDANILAMSSINGARAINGTGSLIWEAAFSLDDPEVVSCGEVSARADRSLVRKGLDLASIMKIASEMVGGYGGGHNIAAGATIPRGKEEVFLEAVDDLVIAQLI